MNRAAVRASIRSHLADPAIGGTYLDEQINSAIDEAHGFIAASFPVERVAAVAVATGEEWISQPGSDALVTAVLLPDGSEIPQATEHAEVWQSAHALLRWTPYAGDLFFNRAVQPAEAGTWSIRYREIPIPPNNDSTDYELPRSVMPALTARATAQLIRSRNAVDLRRGHPVPHSAIESAAELERDARRIIEAHKRRAVGSTL